MHIFSLKLAIINLKNTYRVKTRAQMLQYNILDMSCAMEICKKLLKVNVYKYNILFPLQCLDLPLEITLKNASF